MELVDNGDVVNAKGHPYRKYFDRDDYAYIMPNKEKIFVADLVIKSDWYEIPLGHTIRHKINSYDGRGGHEIVVGDHWRVDSVTTNKIKRTKSGKWKVIGKDNRCLGTYANFAFASKVADGELEPMVRPYSSKEPQPRIRRRRGKPMKRKRK